MKKEDTVYTIEDNEIVETTIEDLIHDHCDVCKDETTTPRGVAPRLHIRNDCELWTWGIQGNNERHLETFDTAEEAEAALWENWIENLLTHDCAPSFFGEKEEAEEVLRERNEYAAQFDN